MQRLAYGEPLHVCSEKRQQVPFVLLGRLEAGCRETVNDLSVERLCKLVRVQFILPASNNDRGHCVADEVGQSPAFGHEAVDAKDERHARDRHGRHDGQRGGKCDETGTGDRPTRDRDRE